MRRQELCSQVSLLVEQFDHLSTWVTTLPTFPNQGATLSLSTPSSATSA
jgi:hypothetical protein